MSRPTILLTGSAGQLGFELGASLAAYGEVVACDRASLDIADPDALRARVRHVGPHLIVNAAAYTAVDRAESEPERAHAVNAVAPGILGEEARRLDAVLVHYSTDYVFDGSAREPYDEEAPVAPLNVYGRTKLAGECAIAASGAKSLVLRTSWVYGLRGSNFFTTIRRLAAEREELRIVADQIGVPNWSHALAQATAALLAQGLPALAAKAGVYHMSARGSASWFDFAVAIIGGAPRPHVLPISTAEYPSAARRPSYAVLATAKLEGAFGISLPDWRETLAACIASEGEVAPRR